MVQNLDICDSMGHEIFSTTKNKKVKWPYSFKIPISIVCKTNKT